MRILVVDDAADIRLFVSAVLEGAGHQALMVEDPMKAISLLTVADVDALILDVMMPRFTGYELLEILRRNARTRLLPVLLLSSLSETKERIRGMRLGATDFLPKPFDPEELVVRVERMVTHRSVSAGGEVGDLDENGLLRVLQGLGHEGRGGVLRLASDRRHGWIELNDGAPAVANYGLLEGAEAMLSMLALKEGLYSFEPSTREDLAAASGGDELHLSRLALRSAQLEDELHRIGDTVPADDAGLFVVRGLSVRDENSGDLPLAEVYERIDILPGVTLGELVAHELAAAVKIRLAVGVLAASSVIEAVIEKAPDEP